MRYNVNWTALKNFAVTRDVSVQWFIYNNVYFLGAFLGQLELLAQIPIVNPTPSGSDQQDFENNYKASGNQPPITFVDQPVPDPWFVTPVDSSNNPYSESNPLFVNANIGSNSLQLINKSYDTGQALYPSSTQETYTTYVGGVTGTPIQQITINYVDSSKTQLLNWQRANWNGTAWIVS